MPNEGNGVIQSPRRMGALKAASPHPEAPGVLCALQGPLLLPLPMSATTSGGQCLQLLMQVLTLLLCEVCKNRHYCPSVIRRTLGPRGDIPKVTWTHVTWPLSAPSCPHYAPESLCHIPLLIRKINDFLTILQIGGRQK